jgi:hypothetical protein
MNPGTRPRVPGFFRGVSSRFPHHPFPTADASATIAPMPLLGTTWYHVTVGTLNSWLPGDPRGFRTRDHKLHSSGHHRSPPPVGEHAGLLTCARSAAGTPLVLPRPLRRVIGLAFVERLEQLDRQLLVISVGGLHCHNQVLLPTDRDAAKREIGLCKRHASFKVRAQLPGRIWARECGLAPIRDRQHQINTYNYIRNHYHSGAWVWTFREGELTGPR